MTMETEWTTFPVCPHCGQVERDAYEIDFGAGLDGDTVIGCGQCGVDYAVQRIVDVYYTTTALAGKEDV